MSDDTQSKTSPAKPRPAAKTARTKTGAAKTGAAKTGAVKKGRARKTPVKRSPGAPPAPPETPETPETPLGARQPDARAALAAGKALRNPSTRHFPVTMFASVLGLAGLGLAWREAADAFGFTDAVGELFLGFAAGFYVAVLGLYALKAVRHPDALVADFIDPIRGCYFAAASMGLLLLSSAAAPHAPWLAEALWLVGAPVNMAVTLATVSGWMTREFHMHHATPVWFLPIAGNLLASIAGTPLGYGEIGWMIFAVGFIFWLVLQVIIFYRLLFHEPMEQPLRPTIVIMLAPPALAAIAFQVLAAGAAGPATEAGTTTSGVATMLYGLTLFIAALLLTQARTLMRLPFALSNWSYTFPLSAFTVAATLYAAQHDSWAADAIAIAGLAAATLITLYVFAITAKALLAGALFRSPSPPAREAETED